MNWVWTGWLLFFAVSFAGFEGYALATGKKTLSRYTYDLSKAWPLLPFICGGLAVGLAVHFWWHWCPEGGVGQGFLEDYNARIVSYSRSSVPAVFDAAGLRHGR